MKEKLKTVGATVAGVLVLLFAVGFYGITHLETSNVPVKAAIAPTKPVAASDIDLNLLIMLTNLDRHNANLPNLQESFDLDGVARHKCEDMATRHYYAHTTPEGHPFYELLQDYSIYYDSAGENLAAYFHDDSAVIVNNDWMKSPEHKANILNPAFTDFGLAACLGEYHNTPTVFVVQDFIQRP